MATGVVNKEDLIEALTRERKRQGLSMGKLAKRMGTSKSVIHRLENGKYNPSIALLDRYAKVLGIRIEFRIWSRM